MNIINIRNYKMKRSILMAFIAIIALQSTLDAKSCATSCQPKVSHKNRKMKTCRKNSSCGAKNTRINKFAKRKCCIL